VARIDRGQNEWCDDLSKEGLFISVACCMQLPDGSIVLVPK
jgi:hypothetical protein